MKKLVYTKVIKCDKEMIEAFKQLEKYNVNVSQFIRQSIKEKLAKDWKSIKEEKERVKLPF